MPEEKWAEEFDKRFIGGITTPTVHRIVENTATTERDVEINGNYVKQFFRQEIERARKESRQSLIKELIEKMPKIKQRCCYYDDDLYHDEGFNRCCQEVLDILNQYK